MQVYELGYLILPSIAEGEVSSVALKLKAEVEKAGGEVLDSESPMKIDLAYSMTKTVGASRYVASDAYIGWMKFESEPEAVANIKDGVGKVDEILRFLVMKVPRETAFTFAKAKALAAEKVAALEKAAEEAESAPQEAVVE